MAGQMEGWKDSSSEKSSQRVGLLLLTQFCTCSPMHGMESEEKALLHTVYHWNPLCDLEYNGSSKNDSILMFVIISSTKLHQPL